MTSAPRPPRRRANRDPYGLLPRGAPIAMILSVVGLVVIASATLAVSNGHLPFNVSLGGGGGTGPGGSGKPEVVKTPTPSGLVVVPSPATPGITIPGTLVYAKDGNIWVQSNGVATQLTSNGNDSMPSFSKDGTAVYFVRTRRMMGYWPVNGTPTNYQMDVPSIVSVPLAGGKETRLFDGLVNPPGRLLWMGFIQGPVVSPDGRTIAMTSDLPDPTRSDVTLKLLNLKTKKITDPGLSQVSPLGHQDPAWSPNGQYVAYVRNDRDGAKGAPRIFTYSVATKKSRAITGPGYLHPSWSPDGHYLAATKTTQLGTDVVIIDTTSGAEVARVTDDGDSWGPVWSPAGNQIAFLHVAGQVIDLRMVQLNGTAPDWTMSDPVDLTSAAGLDGASKPDWFVPAGQLPAPSTQAPRLVWSGSVVVSVTPGYLGRLGARTAATRTVLCLGLDPEPATLPAGFPPGLEGVERFARLLLEAALPHAAAVKPNLAFFEAYGAAGIAALERLRSARTGRHPVRGRRQAGGHRVHGRAPGSRAVRRAGGRRGHREPVSRRGGRRTAAGARRPLCVRPVPHLEPGRRGAPGAPRRRG